MRTDAVVAVSLQSELHAYAALRQQLLADLPDLDDETLTDTLEGATNLREVLSEVVRSALLDEALAEGLKARIAEMKARHDRLQTRAARKRELVLRTMQTAGIGKLTEPDFSASLRQGQPTLELQAEDKIPAAYWKPQPDKLDRQGLIAALRGGVVVEGASLLPPVAQLSIRSK